MKTPRLARWVCGLTLGFGCSDPEVVQTPATPRPPDVMVLVLDTVRADRLSAYGHSRTTSAQLTAIAQSGVLFSDVTAPAPWTWPSHASLFTGRSPWEHGAHWTADTTQAIQFPASHAQRDEGWMLAPMRAEIPTLAELFSAAGYRTVSISANCLLHPELGLMRGFQRAECADTDADAVTRASAVLADQRDTPTFLFVNLLSAHGPYLVAPGVPWSAQHTAAFDPSGAPLAWAKPYLDADIGPGLNLQRYPPGARFNGEMAYAQGTLAIPPEDLTRIRDLYDGDLVRLDIATRDLVTAWNGRGVRNILAVTSDHGEYLGEHQRIGHGLDLHTEALKVPLVITAPGRLPKGEQVDHPVALQRLGATLLELAGVASDASGLSPDSSLLRVREGKTAPHQIASVWGTARWGAEIKPRFLENRRYIRRDTWAAIVSESGAVQLFDLSKDPGMTNDLAPQEAATAAALQQAVKPTFEEAPRTEAPPAISAEVEAQLKTLGYVE